MIRTPLGAFTGTEAVNVLARSGHGSQLQWAPPLRVGSVMTVIQPNLIPLMGHWANVSSLRFPFLEGGRLIYIVSPGDEVRVKRVRQKQDGCLPGRIIRILSSTKSHDSWSPVRTGNSH